MMSDKKFIRKTFFAHQYEKEEQFLSKMAKDGWNFVELHRGIPSKYEFEKVEPADYVYQLDYVLKTEDTPDYHQLFADAGWDEVYRFTGIYDGTWYYFRKRRVEGQETRIFSDAESRLQLYDKLLTKYGIFYIVILFIEINPIINIYRGLFSESMTIGRSLLYLLLCSIITFFILMFGYMLFGLVIKRFQMKKETQKRI